MIDRHFFVVVQEKKDTVLQQQQQNTVDHHAGGFKKDRRRRRSEKHVRDTLFYYLTNKNIYEHIRYWKFLQELSRISEYFTTTKVNSSSEEEKDELRE